MMGGVAMGYTSQALLRHTWEKGEGVVESAAYCWKSRHPIFEFCRVICFLPFCCFPFFRECR